MGSDVMSCDDAPILEPQSSVGSSAASGQTLRRGSRKRCPTRLEGGDVGHPPPEAAVVKLMEVDVATQRVCTLVERVRDTESCCQITQ
jgi:hypothetical protein